MNKGKQLSACRAELAPFIRNYREAACEDKEREADELERQAQLLVSAGKYSSACAWSVVKEALAPPEPPVWPPRGVKTPSG